MRWITFLLLAALTASFTWESVESSSSAARRRLIRPRSNSTMRRVRSRLAKSCGGEVGSVLLQEWYRHSQIVFTATVDGIDRDSGTLNVTLRRIIRSSLAEWTPGVGPPAPSNALAPLPSSPQTTKLVLYDLFAARQNSCVPQFRIRIHDMLLFLVQFQSSSSTLHLVSAPLRITLRNLRLIHTSPGKNVHFVLSLNVFLRIVLRNEDVTEN